MKTYRFFYHYNRNTRKMSVHWRGSCWPARDVSCFVPTETKWQDRQPHLVMQGYASTVSYDPFNDRITIE